MGLTPTTPDYKALAKNWWDSKPGTTGKIVIGAVLAALAVVIIADLGSIITYINSVVESTISLTIHAILLAILLSPIWSKRVNLLCRTSFRLAMRALTGIFVTIDPIGILRENVLEMKKRFEQFVQAVSQLAGSKQRLEADIDHNKSEIQRIKNLVDETNSQIDALKSKPRTMQNDLMGSRLTMQLQNYKTDMGFKMQAITNESPILDQTNDMYEKMSRLKDLAEFKIQSLQSQADQYEQQRKMILASQKALGAANSIMRGDAQQLDLIDQTLEYLNTDAANTIGAMNDFNRFADKYIMDKDIQVGAASREADKLLAAMEGKMGITDGGDKVPTVLDTAQGSDGVYTPVEKNLPAANDYTKYLK